ncbi:alcohol dehydrogenase catalytic domain-containing protein, partial [Staphylococcus aureus]|uniref:alcohol dehydrogenase catalytic domain-containing protein n=1 Tax=Staphylococcus aureus TaxID=1280 RepID=UPI00065C0190
VNVGDKETGCPAIPCYQCESCLKGEYARCDKLLVIGSYEPGTFAEYVKFTAQNVLKVPDNEDYIVAAMVEQSDVDAHRFYKSHIQPGMTVAVMGSGRIGFIAYQWARIFGGGYISAIDID